MSDVAEVYPQDVTHSPSLTAARSAQHRARYQVLSEQDCGAAQVPTLTVQLKTAEVCPTGSTVKYNCIIQRGLAKLVLVALLFDVACKLAG